MIAEYGFALNNNITLEELYNLALMIAIEENIVSPDTPIEWLDRILNEMILSRQRLSSHFPRKGNFNAVFFPQK